MANLSRASDIAVIVTAAAHLIHRCGVHCQPKRCAVALLGFAAHVQPRRAGSPQLYKLPGLCR